MNVPLPSRMLILSWALVRPSCQSLTVKSGSGGIAARIAVPRPSGPWQTTQLTWKNAAAARNCAARAGDGAAAGAGADVAALVAAAVAGCDGARVAGVGAEAASASRIAACSGVRVAG